MNGVADQDGEIPYTFLAGNVMVVVFVVTVLLINTLRLEVSTTDSWVPTHPLLTSSFDSKASFSRTHVSLSRFCASIYQESGHVNVRGTGVWFSGAGSCYVSCHIGRCGTS